MERVGIYAGSFNPFHIGHEDIYKQASEVFDRVIIAQGVNTQKENPPILSFKDREFLWYKGLLSDVFKENITPYTELYLVRGLRNSFDVGYEDNLRNTLLDFDPTIRVIYFFCHKKYEHVSSSMIRSLYPFGKDVYERYLP